MAVQTVKGQKGIAMEGLIATWYARMTRKNIDYYRSEAKKVAEHVAAGGAVLEVAPGPGYLSIALAKLGHFQITGLDISAKFVKLARQAAREAGVAIEFRQGNAAQMPFDDDRFDFIICTAAFKNFAEPILALDEMYRVVKPGGTALIVDLRGDVSPESMDRHVAEELHLTGINAFLTKFAFRHMLIKRAYTKAQFIEMVSQSKFGSARIEEDTIGLQIWLQK